MMAVLGLAEREGGCGRVVDVEDRFCEGCAELNHQFETRRLAMERRVDLYGLTGGENAGPGRSGRETVAASVLYGGMVVCAALVMLSGWYVLRILTALALGLPASAATR